MEIGLRGSVIKKACDESGILLGNRSGGYVPKRRNRYGAVENNSCRFLLRSEENEKCCSKGCLHVVNVSLTL